MNYSNPTLTHYLNNIKSLPVLSRKEEKSLAKKARNGDEKAKQRLVVCNLKFVVLVAKKYVNSGIPLIDLISEGNLGLIKAIDNFDETRGFHFISYAVHWIKQSIIKSIAEKSMIVRLPLSWNNHLYYLNREMGANDTSENKVVYLSQKLGIKEEKVKKLLKVSKPRISLEKHSFNYGDENLGNLLNSVKDERVINPEKSLIDKSIKGDIGKVLKFLTPIERKVVIDRFGLKSNGQGKKLLEIGKELNLTKERVRQIEKKALDKLKDHVNNFEINQYLKI